MRFARLALAAVLAAVPATNLHAQFFANSSNPNTDNSPFWDRNSDDGTKCNIGYVLTGQTSSSTCLSYKIDGSFVAPWSTANFSSSFFGRANGNSLASLSSFAFQSTGATVSYFGGIAGADPLRKIYVRNWTTNVVTALNVGTVLNIAVGNVFDLGIASFIPNSPTPNFWSSGNAGVNQFAVFGNGLFGSDWANCGSACWVGAEDISPNADYDYNDGIVKITGANVVVPEPSSILLVAGGLIGLATAARRRRTQA